MAIVSKLDRMMKLHHVSLMELSEGTGKALPNLSHIKTGKILAIRFETLNLILDFFEKKFETSYSVDDLFAFIPDAELGEDDVVCFPTRLRR